MTTLISEIAGETLQGAINGSNRDFTVTYDMSPLGLGVFHNGRLKIADLDDGYEVVLPRTIRMREAPLAGDTLEVQYQLLQEHPPMLGGIPEMTSGEVLEPVLLTNDMRPGITGTDPGATPGLSSDELRPGTSSVDGDLRPDIVSGQWEWWLP